MIDDLQTLCTAALRLLYSRTTAASEEVDDDEGSDTGGPARPAARLPSPPPSPQTAPIDRRAVEAFIESLEMEDNPRLQVESAWALTVIADRLTPEQQSVVQGDVIPLLIHLLVSNDRDVVIKAVKIVEGLIPGDCAILRNFDLGPIVRGVTEDDADRQAHFANLLSRLLAYDIECPEFIQRIIDSGVLPRFVEFLRRDDHPVLPALAVSVLEHVARCGTPDQIQSVVDDVGECIPNIVRVLGHPNSDEETNILTAEWIGSVAHSAPAYRDLVLQSGPVPKLLDLVQSTDLKTIQSGTYALRQLCKGNPPPNIAPLRPAVPTLARLVNHTDDEVAADACGALAGLGHAPEEVLQPVVDAGACRRLVELLRHPDVQVVRPVLDLVGIIVGGDDQQLQAIIDNQPLPSLVTLLSSPDRLCRRKACSIIGNVAKDRQERIQEIINHCALPPLLRCLADEALDVRILAAGAVGEDLAGSGTPQQVWSLVEAGCLPLLCRLLADPEFNPYARSLALAGIENALAAASESRPDRGAPGGINAVAARIASDRGGGLAKIRALTRHPDEGLRERASRVVATYFGANQGATAGRGRRRRTRSDHNSRASDDEEGAGNPPPPLRRRTRRS